MMLIEYLLCVICVLTFSFAQWDPHLGSRERSVEGKTLASGHVAPEWRGLEPGEVQTSVHSDSGTVAPSQRALQPASRPHILPT